jgi:hypothetical protein
MEPLFQVSLKLQAKDEKELAEKTQALEMIVNNLNRDSLVILANKTTKRGINDTIKLYQHIF